MGDRQVVRFILGRLPAISGCRSFREMVWSDLLSWRYDMIGAWPDHVKISKWYNGTWRSHCTSPTCSQICSIDHTHQKSHQPMPRTYNFVSLVLCNRVSSHSLHHEMHCFTRESDVTFLQEHTRADCTTCYATKQSRPGALMDVWRSYSGSLERRETKAIGLDCDKWYSGLWV